MMNGVRMPRLSKARWERILEMERLLCARFPRTFFPFRERDDAVYPLKVGIAKDIVSMIPDIDQKALSHFMKHYVTLPRYLKITGRAGMPRIDLNGDVAGVIGDVEATSALKYLDVINARRPKKRSAAPAPALQTCKFTGKANYLSAFEADQAMVRTHQRVKAVAELSGTSFKCKCGFFHWGRN